jgi:hypothetical protein
MKIILIALKALKLMKKLRQELKRLELKDVNKNIKQEKLI